MGRSHRGARIGGTLLALAVSLGCASSGPRTVRSGEVDFPPGKHVVRSDDVRVELLGATYDAAGVAVHLEIANRGDAAVVVERSGLVLAHEGLEFPVSAATDPPLPARVEVPARGKARVRARFDTGGRVTAQSILRLRHVRRGAAWIEGLDLWLPGGVDPELERPDPQQPRRP